MKTHARSYIPLVIMHLTHLQRVSQARILVNSRGNANDVSGNA